MDRNKKGPDGDCRILLTGGHGATTGLAVIQELKKKIPDSKLFWIGTKNIISGSNATSIEYKIFPNMGVKYFSINAGKLQTKFTRHTIPLLIKIPVGFIQSLSLVLRIRPRLVVSFGGFSSFPVVFWAKILGIPVVVHEQTVVAGRASIVSSYFANKVALAREQSIRYFPKGKTEVIGNPIISEIVDVVPKLKPGNPKLILVLGGSRGSEFINRQIWRIKDKLTPRFRLIHVTGEKDFEKYNKYINSNYEVFGFVSPFQMAKLYSRADIIVSRAGANTVSEILHVKRPSILIPLPKTYLDEQTKNAEYAAGFGFVKILKEDLCENNLLKTIEEIDKSWFELIWVGRAVDVGDSHAASKLVKLLSDFL